MDASCNCCGAKFNEAKELPDIQTDARGFFQMADTDCGGSLSQQEVLTSLGACLPIPREKLEDGIKNHWFEWDPDNGGTITLREFLAKEGGLRDFAVTLLRDLRARGGVMKPQDQSEIPSLETHPKQWFEYWDADNSGNFLNKIITSWIFRKRYS